MTTYVGWYDNGTGYLEGPYVEEHPDLASAEEANDVGYGGVVYEQGEKPDDYDPNMKGNDDNVQNSKNRQRAC